MRFAVTYLVLLSLLLSSCRYNRYYPVNFDLNINQITALNLEEDDHWYSSGEDEIRLRYSVVSLTPGDPPGQYDYDGAGEEMTFGRRGQYIRGFQPLHVEVPAQGKVFVSVVLTERDDYSSIINTLDDIGNILDIAEFIADFDRKRRLKLPGRTFKMASKAVTIAKTVITVVDLIDTDDEIIAFCTVLDKEQLMALSELRSSDFVIDRKGSNWFDDYRYQIGLSFLARREPGVKPVKERIPAIASPVYVDFSPLQIDQPLNDYWMKSRDPLMEKVSESNYEWSDGAYNKNFSASLGFSVSPAFRMNKKFTWGKFYMRAGYRRLPYLLNFDYDYLMGQRYFSNNTSIPAGPAVEEIELDLMQLSAAPHLRIMGSYLFWDIGGGVHYHIGKARFKGLMLDNPNASFVYDESTNIIERDYQPFIFTKIGLGNALSSNLLLHVGAMAFKPELLTNENFEIFLDEGSTTNPVTPTISDEWRFNFSIGLTGTF